MSMHNHPSYQAQNIWIRATGVDWDEYFWSPASPHTNLVYRTTPSETLTYSYSAYKTLMETTGEYYHQLDPYPLILPATLARLYAVLAIDPQVRVQLRCCGALDVHIFDEQLDRLIEDDGVCDEDPVSPVAKCTSCLTECQLDEEAALCDDSRCTISELLLMFMSKKIRKMGIMRIEQIE